MNEQDKAVDYEVKRNKKGKLNITWKSNIKLNKSDIEYVKQFAESNYSLNKEMHIRHLKDSIRDWKNYFSNHSSSGLFGTIPKIKIDGEKLTKDEFLQLKRDEIEEEFNENELTGRLIIKPTLNFGDKSLTNEQKEEMKKKVVRYGFISFWDYIKGSKKDRDELYPQDYKKKYSLAEKELKKLIKGNLKDYEVVNYNSRKKNPYITFKKGEVKKRANIKDSEILLDIVNAEVDSFDELFNEDN